MIKLAKLLYLVLCLETLFSVAYRGVFLVTHSFALAWAAAALVLGFGALCFAYRSTLLGILQRALPVRWLESATCPIVSVAVGLLLRIAWVLRFPATLKADGIAYFNVAVQLAAHRYPGAFWPPGLPLVLAPLMAVFGPYPSVTILASMLFFVATSCAAWLLANEIAGRASAGLAVVLLALWPGYITIGGINSKEGLIALVLTFAMLLYVKGAQAGGMRWPAFAGAGLLVGFATLTQPGCMLFPIVIVGIELLRGTKLLNVLVRTAAFGVAMLVAILPWTARNQAVVHRPVFISANGGSVFYRANNPLANASYSPEGEVHLPNDIYEADRIGYREGKRWIVHHPAAFVVLAVRKQIVYLGDDGIGVYETLKRGLRPSDLLYGGAKAICSAYWLMLWTLLLMGTTVLFQRKPLWKWYGLCFLPVAYQWFIDSIFESGSRHHLSDVAFLAVLAALVLTSRLPSAASAREA